MKYLKVFERNPAVTILFFILVITFFLDFGLGNFLRRKSPNSFRVSHYYFHHGILPLQKVVTEWAGIKYIFTSNSLGFRDSEKRYVEKQFPKKRVLFLGDSHTEGVGVNFEDTFTGKLIELLNDSVEILNAAAVSYSPIIHFLKAKYLLEVEKLKVDEIFVFIDISDLQNEIVYKSFHPPDFAIFHEIMNDLKNFFLRNSFISQSAKNIHQHAETKRFIEKSEIFDQYSKNEEFGSALKLYAGFFEGFNDNTLLSNPSFHGISDWIYNPDLRELADKGLHLGQENITKLKELCDKYSIKLTISVHPWQQQVNLGDIEDYYVISWKNFAIKNNISFINLYPTFIYHPLGTTFYIPQDNHWNEKGHLLVATELMKYIGLNEITPSD